MPTSSPSRPLLARRLLIGAAIALAVVVTGYLALSVGASDDSDDPRADASNSAGSDNDNDSDNDSGDATGGAGDGSSDGTASPGEDAGEDPGDEPNGGVEVLPPSPSQSGLPGLEPPDLSPLVRMPLPAADSARGRLVKGYPRRAVPLAPESTITTSSVSPNERRLQVALTAETTRHPGQILRFYRTHLAKLGFIEQPSTAVGGSEGAAFTRGENSVTIVATNSSYAVSAVLVAEG